MKYEKAFFDESKSKKLYVSLLKRSNERILDSGLRVGGLYLYVGSKNLGCPGSLLDLEGM